MRLNAEAFSPTLFPLPLKPPELALERSPPVLSELCRSSLAKRSREVVSSAVKFRRWSRWDLPEVRPGSVGEFKFVIRLWPGRGLTGLLASLFRGLPVGSWSSQWVSYEFPPVRGKWCSESEDEAGTQGDPASACQHGTLRDATEAAYHATL